MEELKEEPIDSFVIDHVHNVLFGESSPEEIERWFSQGFNFYEDRPKRYGLAQNHGGPCGVLAAVQAMFIYQLLFSGNFPDLEVDPELGPVPTDDERVEALAGTLTFILNQAKVDGNSDTVLVIGDQTGYATRELKTVVVPADKDLFQTILALLSNFQHESGVVYFVISVLLTRGLEQVQADRDDLSQPLVQRFGHSSQDLVNLFLCGRAASNIHDGDKYLGDEGPDAWALKGIPNEVPCGYLTSLEVLRYSKAGDFYKNPLNPIWVIGSASHYSVAFSLDPRVGKLSKLEKLEQRAREIFNQLDPYENGFIPTQKLGDLMDRLDCDAAKKMKIRRNADPDGMGIVIWTNFWNAFSNSGSGSGKHTEPWSCGICTFVNAADRNSCEMCGSPAPPPPAAQNPDVDEEEKSPASFTMFHFNGIANFKAAEARSTRMEVTQDGMLGMQGQGSIGLAEVLQTRWPNAMVDYHGADNPKIT